MTILDAIATEAKTLGLVVLVDAQGRVELVKRPRWLHVVGKDGK